MVESRWKRLAGVRLIFGIHTICSAARSSHRWSVRQTNKFYKDRTFSPVDAKVKSLSQEALRANQRRSLLIQKLSEQVNPSVTNSFTDEILTEIVVGIECDS